MKVVHTSLPTFRIRSRSTNTEHRRAQEVARRLANFEAELTRAETTPSVQARREEILLLDRFVLGVRGERTESEVARRLTLVGAALCNSPTMTLADLRAADPAGLGFFARHLQAMARDIDSTVVDCLQERPSLPAVSESPTAPALERPSATASMRVMPPKERGLHIRVQTLTMKEIHVSAQRTESIDALKSKIQDQEGIPPDQQRLIYDGQQLADSASLAQYAIGDESVLYMVLRLRGD